MCTIEICKSSEKSRVVEFTWKRNQYTEIRKLIYKEWKKRKWDKKQLPPC